MKNQHWFSLRAPKENIYSCNRHIHHLSNPYIFTSNPEAIFDCLDSDRMGKQKQSLHMLRGFEQRISIKSGRVDGNKRKF